MASDYDPKTLIPGVIAVLVVLGIVAIGSKPFQPLRPEPAKTLDYSTSTPFNIQARLWQDPFAAIVDYDKENNTAFGNSALLELVGTVLLEQIKNQSRIGESDLRYHFVECWMENVNLNNVDNQHKCRKLIDALSGFGEEIEQKQTDQFGHDVLGIYSVRAPTDPISTRNDSDDAGATPAAQATEDCLYQNDQDKSPSHTHPNCDFRTQVIEKLSVGIKWTEATKLKEKIIEDILGLRTGYIATELFEPIQKLASPGDPSLDSVYFIGVSLPSGSYSDLAERRMRSRYAVITALSDRGYHPVNPDHISVWRSMSRRCLFPSTCVVSAAPYEWFVKTDSASATASAAVVMWFKDEDIGDYPLAKFLRIAVLVDGAYAAFKSQVKSNSATLIEYSLLGPYSSNHFANVYAERPCADNRYREELFSCVDLLGQDNQADGTRPQHRSNKEIFNALRIYNWSATKLFSAETESAAASQDGLAWKELALKPERVLAQDREVAHAIVSELKKRGLLSITGQANEELWPGDACQGVHDNNLARAPPQPTSFLKGLGMGAWQVLLVGESDTEYSRELSQSISDSLSCYRASVDQVTYLRGLDGQLPGDAGGRGSAKRSSINGYEDLINEIAADTGQDGAAGRNQFDYLRRLVDDVAIDGRTYDAVGVLGSDVYDKILVMQALRARYPNALYFTTDLDALYLHTSIYPAVKNALVGSSYDLTTFSGNGPKQTGKRQIPFRDSYQTSLYEAVSMAAEPSYARVPRTPAVFEIGRNQLFRLSPAGTATDTSTAAAFFGTTKFLFAPLLGAVAPTPVHVLLYLFAGLTAFFMVIRELAIGSSWIGYRNRYALVSIVMVVFVYIVSIALFREEVSSAFAGVSVAPGFVLIWVALGLTLLIYLQLNTILKNFATGFVEKHFTAGAANPGAASFENNALWQQFLASMGFKADAQGSAGNTADQAEPLALAPDRPQGLLGEVERFLDKIPFRALLVIYLFLLVFLMPPATVYLSFEGKWWLPRPVVIVSAYLLVLVPITILVLRLRKLMVSLQVLMTNMDKRFDWDAEIINRYTTEQGLSPEHAKYGMDLLLIAELTSAIYRFFYGPLLVILILFCSRLPFFDQWPVADGISYGLVSLFLVSIYQSYRVHRTALDIRDDVLAKLKDIRIDIMAGRWIANKTSKDDTLKLHDYLVTDLSEMHKGAYLPLSQQPFVRLLLFLAGASGIVFLQFMPGLFF